MTLLDIRNTLNRLIVLAKDGEAAFAYSARRARSFALHLLFQHRAEDCRRTVRHLQQQARLHGGVPRLRGSATADLRLSWVAVRCASSGNPDLVLIDACERSDASVLRTYRRLLRGTLPDSLRQLLEAQHDAVAAEGQRIQQLHERLRSVA